MARAAERLDAARGLRKRSGLAELAARGGEEESWINTSKLLYTAKQKKTIVKLAVRPVISQSKDG